MAAAALLALSLPVAAHAQAAAVTFDIPSQDLASALKAFGRTARQQVVFDGAAVRGKTSAAVVGAYTAEQGLRILLTGTGMQAEHVPGGVIAIRGASAPGPQPGGASSGGDDVSPVIDQVTVTGTHINGAPNLGPTIQTFDRTDIERAGDTTLAQVFTQLPQNLAEISPQNTMLGQNLSAANLLNGGQLATGVSLRGLGPGSTLTLVDGSRRPTVAGGTVVDIGAIPLTAIDHIDIATGGRSAVYGSDAVAGVVNLVTRKDFDGAETTVHYGADDRGDGGEYQFDQIAGVKSARGGFVVAYEYDDATSLDVSHVKAGLTVPSVDGLTPVRGAFNVNPSNLKNNVFAAGHYDVNDRVQVYATGIYSYQHLNDLIAYNSTGIDYPTGPNTFGELVDSTQYSVNGGMKARLFSDWSVDAKATYGRALSTSDAFSTSISTPADDYVQDTKDDMRFVDGTAVFQGTLFDFNGASVKGAFGSEWRQETLTDSYLSIQHASRTVAAGFGEILLPVFNRPDVVGLGRWDISIAGRYDAYSDAGDKFTPQIGTVWEPIPGLKLQGAYSEAYRAPDLSDLVLNTSGTIAYRTDPTAPGGRRAVLILNGVNPNLKPEQAKTYDAGVDWRPGFARWAHLSLTYFNIDYANRLNRPALGSDALNFLLEPQKFADVLTTVPTLAQLTSAFADTVTGSVRNSTGVKLTTTPAGVLAALPNIDIFDNRLTNISAETVEGIDLFAGVDFNTAGGAVRASLNLTDTFDHSMQATPASQAVNAQDEVGKPVAFRWRADLGWTGRGMGADLFINYVAGYKDIGRMPVTSVASWTTVDLSLQLDAEALSGRNWLHGTYVTLAILNLFDRAPPSVVTDAYGLNYDPANANAEGRMFSVTLRKRW